MADALRHLSPADSCCSTDASTAFRSGCLQDDVQSFLESVLPYERFSLRLPKCEIPQLDSVLRSISTREVARLQVCSRAKPSTLPEPAPRLHLAVVHTSVCQKYHLTVTKPCINTLLRLCWQTVHCHQRWSRLLPLAADADRPHMMVMCAVGPGRLPPRVCVGGRLGPGVPRRTVRPGLQLVHKFFARLRQKWDAPLIGSTCMISDLGIFAACMHPCTQPVAVQRSVMGRLHRAGRLRRLKSRWRQSVRKGGCRKQQRCGPGGIGRQRLHQRAAAGASCGGCHRVMESLLYAILGRCTKQQERG